VERAHWQERVVVEPDLHNGDPCIRGTRVPVAVIVGSLADGMTVQEIRDAYPQLSLEDIRAALAYAAEVIRQDILAPLGVPVRSGGVRPGTGQPAVAPNRAEQEVNARAE